MTKSVPITDMLDDVARREDWHSNLVDYFRIEMIGRVKRNLSSEVLSRVEPEGIYLASIRSALSEVANGRFSPKDRSEFRNFLAGIVDRKRRSAAKREQCEKHSLKKTEPLAGDLKDLQTLTPANRAEANEIVDACWAFCLRGNTGQRRDVTILGIMGQIPARRIREILATSYDDGELRSKRSIELWIEKSMKELREHLKEKFGPDVGLS